MNWKAILTWGVILGAVVVVLQLAWGLTGWYAHPVMANLFVPLAIVINLVAIVLALRATRADHGYGQQVATGVLVGLVGGVLITAGSVLLTSVIVPAYFEEMAAMVEVVLVERGLPAETAAQQAAAIRQMTPVQAALNGFIGTVVTSLVTALVAGIWLRRKGATAVRPEATT